MKIGIITILKVDNYGADLQAYATQAILNKMGYDAEIIDYLFYKHHHHKKTSLSRPVFKMSLKKRIREFLYPIIEKYRNRNNLSRVVRDDKYRDFENNNISFSQTYDSIESLYSAEMDYDIYISGSDQIWNPGIYSSLKPYFLDFAPNDKTKIAYASSFGVQSLLPEMKKVYREALTKFKHIGVRELSAVEILRDIGIKANHVLDPTLLLDCSDWRSVATKVDNLPDSYVLLYEITPSPEINEIGRKIAMERGMKVVKICKNTSSDSNELAISDAGPGQFIYLFDHASFVVTNSFHGTAFAINFQKQFLVVTPQRKNNNSRQQSLLKLFDISDRIISDSSDIKSAITIDFQKVNAILDAEREKSINFLKTAING